jgi:hypothetical protein
MMSSLGIVFMAVAGAATLSAPTGQGDAGPIVALSTSSCDFERAREIELATAIRDYARLRGQCITVRGWNRGRSIYQSLGQARAGVSIATANRPHGLGIYGDEAALASLSAEPRRVAAAGIVGACENLNQGEGSGGYCHSVTEGGFLILGELRPLG